MNPDNEVRYVLTDKGIRFLAERAGVTPAVLQASGRVKPKKLWAGEGQSGVRYVEHAIGTNRSLARLAADARATGGRLIEALNDAESAQGFSDVVGRPSSIRPDASGTFEVAGRRFPFFLEYDRGTLDGGDFRRKFEGYRRYYERGAWRSRFGAEPLLLFVCSDDDAERRVVRAASAGEQALPVLATTEWRISRDRGGALGTVWTPAVRDTSSSVGSPRLRVCLVPPDSEVRGRSDPQCQ